MLDDDLSLSTSSGGRRAPRSGVCDFIRPGLEERESGLKEGMIRMDDSILSLYNDNLITKETALTYAHRPKELINKLEN